MNKKAQTLGLSIISAIVFFIIGLMIVNLITPEVDNFRSGLSCSSAETISDGTKLLCLVGDITVIYWIVLVFSVVLGTITARVVL